MKRLDTGDPHEYVAVCEDCDGQGSRQVFFDPSDPSHGSEWGECPDCDGTGQVEAEEDDFE